MQPVFTIGHSRHAVDHFIGLLRQHDIAALYDVRSTPYSGFNPQFNREELEKVLLAQRISYRFLGKELGARSDDPACYEDGRIRYRLLAQTASFKQGLQHVLDGMNQDLRLALMCAEQEPLACHRTILIARHLAPRSPGVQHIHANGNLESHADAEGRLARMFDLWEDDMFRSREELLAEAYCRQEERIAYETALGANNDDDRARRIAG